MKGRLLLCTDLDRTLLPNGEAPESPRARPLFARLAATEGVTLAYVTGRDAGRVEEARRHYDLPAPDHVIADVGATLLTANGERSADWDAAIAGGWRGRSREQLAQLIGALPGLTLQDPSRQGRFKLSYEFRPATGVGAAAAAISGHLERAGLAVHVVPSIDDDTGLVDVLPAAAGKAAAVEFLRASLGLSRDEVLCAGDSGNDLDMLTGPLPAVLVANARPEVREAAMREAERGGHPDKLHLAVGGALGLDGNYAAGILEGLLHFRPDWAELLEAPA